MEALDELSMNGISALHELAAMRAEKVRQPARCFRGVVHQGGTSQRQGDTTARACVSTTSWLSELLLQPRDGQSAWRVKRAAIHGHGFMREGFFGSDHCPMVLELERTPTPTQK